MLSRATGFTRWRCGCLPRNNQKIVRPGIPFPTNKRSASSFRYTSAIYYRSNTGARSNVNRSPPLAHATMEVARSSSSSGQKNVGLTSLTFSRSLRNQVWTLIGMPRWNPSGA